MPENSAKGHTHFVVIPSISSSRRKGIDAAVFCWVVKLQVVKIEDSTDGTSGV